MPPDPSHKALQARIAALEAQNRRLKQLEADLKRNLNFTETLLASIPTPIFYKDARGRYQGCNKAFSEIMGVTNEKIRGKTVQELWPSEHSTVYHQKDLELLTHPRLQTYEFEVKDQRGKVRPVIYYKNVFRDENGKIAGIVGGFTDITDIRQAQFEQQTLFAMSLDMICIADINTATFLKINPAFTATLGYREAELLSVPFTDFIHPDDVDATRRTVTEKLKAGEKVINFKNRYRCKNGEYRWLNWVSHPVPERGVTYAVAHDITDEIEAYETLRSQRDMLNNLFDNIPLGITFLDRNGRLLEANKGFSGLTGYTREEIENLDDWFSKAYPDPAYRRRVVADWQAARQTAKVVREFKVTCRDGRVKDIEFHSVFLADGRTLVTMVDITDRRQAMEEWETTHRLLQSVLKAVPDLLIVVDRKFQVQYSNYKGHNLIAPLDNSALRRTCYGRFKQLNAPCEDCSAASVFAEGKPVEREMVNPADGRISEVRAFPIFDDLGRVTHVVEYVRDITEIRQAQDEIRRRQQFLELVLHHAPDAIVTLDAQHRVIDWNPGAVKMFGYSPEEVIGVQLDDLVARHHHLVEAGSKTAQVLSGVRVEAFETIRYRKDGTPVHVIAAGSPIIIDSDLKGVVAVYTDITDRVRSEEALRLSHQRFITVLDSIDATIYVADMDTYEILFMNRHMTQAFGIDLTGKTCWKAFRNESAPCTQCTNDRLVDANGKPTGVVVWQGQNPVNGKWYINYDRAIEWIDGRLVRIQIATDITELKRLEEGLLQAQKMEAIGTLAGGIAHDFNNMLSAILGRSELMLLGMAKDDPQRSNLQEILRATQRSADLTKQLLAFARKQAISPKVLDLNSVVEDSLKMLRRLIGEDIELIWHPSTRLWAVKMDPTQVDQLLTNLCVNARDAIAGVGTITIETKNRQLDQEYCTVDTEFKPGEYVMLAVSDDGCGMDKQTLESAFEPFFTTKKVGEGTGLGLATAYGIVKQNDGFINVFSEPGMGTTFELFLPKSTQALEDSAKASDISIAKGTETVLVVEDEASILDLISNVLERFGYTVLAARSPSQAIDMVADYQGIIHLLITDVVMPEMNGKALRDQIVRHRPTIKVLFMSGYTSNVIMHRGILENDVHFLQKPFSINVLARSVRKALDDGNR